MLDNRACWHLKCTVEHPSLNIYNNFENAAFPIIDKRITKK